MKRNETPLAALILTCLTLVGCGPREHVQSAPLDLIDAVAAEASLMPTNLISEVDESGNAVASTPRYVIIVRHVSRSEAGQDMLVATTAVQEWVSARGYGDEGARFIAELRERAFLDKASYRVSFAVDTWTYSNAVVSVGMSYPERGGQTRQWTFAKQTGCWVRVKDESKGWWD